MDLGTEPPVWTPQCHNRVDLPGFCFMHGGPEGMQLPEHEHTETQLELHFLLQRNRAQLSPAELPAFHKVIPPGKAHAGRWESGNEVIVILVEQEPVAKAKDELLRSSSLPIMDVAFAVDAVFQTLGATLRREFLFGGVADTTFLEAIGTVLIGHLARQRTSGTEQRKQGGRLTPAQLRKVVEAIRSERSRSIASLAAEVGLGPHQFTRLFRQTTGGTPYQFILQRRLAEACALLETSDLSLVQIGLQLGFASQSHFTSAFQNRYKSTPARYRRDRRR